MNYGRYEIQKELGKGAMGVVYQAHDPQIDRMVALKVLRQDRVAGEDFVRRFLKEAQAIGRLTHPNIVTVYDVGEDQDTIYIAMEFLDGQTMNEIFRETQPDLEKIIDIGAKVANALDYSHKRGIIHRDIKPSNIMLTQDGQVKITDFGVARIENPDAPQMTQSGEILGTPNYMSPEQVKGETVDGRSDLYSLGIILYELSTGRRPYGGKNLASIFNAILQEEPVSPMDVEPFVSRGLPSTLSTVLLKSIEKNPEARFQTGGAMAEALSACLAPSQPPVQAPLPEKKASRALVMALVLCLGILLAGGGFFYYKQHTGLPQAEMSVPQAPLRVESNVDGAQLYVDGVFRGKTPIRLELPVGSHEIRLSLPGYYGWEGTVPLEETGKEIRGVLVPMEEAE